MTAEQFFDELQEGTTPGWFKDRAGAIRKVSYEGIVPFFCPLTYLCWRKFQRLYFTADYQKAAWQLCIDPEIAEELMNSADGKSSKYRAQMETLLEEKSQLEGTPR
ncbi:MAG: hypothetical protein ACRDF4_08840 [Rhabdochlamydiaceae bacterium]